MAVVLAFPGTQTVRLPISVLVARTGMPDDRIARRLNDDLGGSAITAEVVAIWRAGRSRPADPIPQILEAMGAPQTTSTLSPRTVARHVLRELVEASGLGLVEFADRMAEQLCERVPPETLAAWLDATGPCPATPHLVAAARIAGRAGFEALLGLGRL